MGETAHHPQNLAERLISAVIQSTWLLWVVGGLYIAGPVLGWTLAGMATKELYLAPGKPAAERPPRIGLPIHIWLLGMAAMLLILLAGHVLNDLGLGKTIKSSIGWAKGWALIALYPFAGAVLNIRPQILYRAVCKLGLQTLFILPLFLAAPFIGLPGLLYVSPLSIVGGSGPEYFAVILYTLEPGTGVPRWQFFAPWSPAAGMVAVVHILCALEEKDVRWKAIGVMAALAVALLSQSRLALVAIAAIWPMAFAVSRLREPWMWFMGAPAVLALGLFAPQLVAFVEQAMASFTGARADSSRVRAALGRIAVERWQNEAFWFGHGVVENGPHLVEYMPIGSHHSWYGLLFVKGLSGAIALALPLIVSVLATARLALDEPLGRVALAMLLVLIFYSFGENLEMLSYLYWPALVLIGMASRRLSERAAAQGGGARPDLSAP
ncbi:O-antigen ligase domain-containing protein [Novosphingobium beihaiensis]|uniref:O-antigen ligase domain-containing protein n=1 Tax=Novosphingobium beihaiensis TaxID=2930389 RepID=A0ABT0BV41_9SPHN|nr:O-antigen ligase domain-containing protein [Novosphingobium beihaiensis]MCJ2188850.1 O-antigen ligase domain-containing protein [Novosphingobium beihaiensis]